MSLQTAVGSLTSCDRQEAAVNIRTVYVKKITGLLDAITVLHGAIK